jgi:hypothetical protein
MRRLFPLSLSIVITYMCVLVGQVLFRANSLSDAVHVFGDMTGLHGVGPGWPAFQYLLIGALLGIVWLMPNTQEILGETQRDDEPNRSILPNLRWQPTAAWCCAASLALLVSMFFSADGPTFLYFQF